MLDRITHREPLVGDGKSGSQLESGLLDGDTPVVIKHALTADDWIMQATGDDGRIARLWDAGVFAHLPSSIDSAILDIQAVPGGAVIVMRDVSASLVSPTSAASIHQDALRAAAALHGMRLADAAAHTCPLSAYYAFLSPAVCARYAADHEVPRLALDAWPRFFELAPDDVGAAIASVHADPARFAAALLDRPSTLVHGDLKLANLGVHDDRLIVLDWGTLTTWAPPAVDYAWYLAINAAALGRAHDDLLEDIRHAEPSCDETALVLALVGALAQLGWEKALGATADDASVRERELRGLQWWCGHVRSTLDLLPF
jgi:hypothetical protein